MSEFRCDRLKIKHYEITPEGFLNFTAPIARVGTLRYRNDDGSIRNEHVSEQVLIDSAPTFKHKPITRSHPPERVTAQNAERYAVGMTGNITWMDSGFLWINGTVMNQDAIAEIVSGKEKELSCGYGVRTQPRGDGDFDQIHREGNHLATCQRARAEGAEFKLDDGENLFSEDTIEADQADQAIDKPSKHAEKTMTYKATLNGIEMEFDSMEIAAAIRDADKDLTKLRADADKQAGQLTTATDSISELKTKLDGLQLDYDELQENRTDAAETLTDSQVAEVIADRMKVWNEVLPFMRSDSPDYEPDYTLNPIGIMAEAVKVANPELADHIDGLNLDEGESAGFIKGLYAGLNTKQFANKKTSRHTVDSLLEGIREGRLSMAGDMFEPDTANEALMEKARGNYTMASKKKKKPMPPGMLQ